MIIIYHEQRLLKNLLVHHSESLQVFIISACTHTHTHTRYNILPVQSSSSELSIQLGTPSHLCSIGIHLPDFLH